ncbi:hypothetical protein [Nitrospirillum sp. BR 11828]|uniref:hypothetical protein n=1 Tax=Nitrospirillum sp. BR 11828 TaxID=3104325 RepID=UPI002ACA861A|nr:hypothetical protein [Nitrospirillum sp. BR 11828]MDZ5647167.1 hypothetical protein [Nitrospirillum sp. BR 11828]
MQDIAVARRDQVAQALFGASSLKIEQRLEWVRRFLVASFVEDLQEGRVKARARDVGLMVPALTNYLNIQEGGSYDADRMDWLAGRVGDDLRALASALAGGSYEEGEADLITRLGNRDAAAWGRVLVAMGAPAGQRYSVDLIAKPVPEQDNREELPIPGPAGYLTQALRALRSGG